MYQRKFAKMDVDKMLRHVSNLNDYISVTQEVSKYEHKSSKVQFNMSTVLLLKKVRSMEIEYFNKYEGNGAALVLFERMVDQPPSKTWGLLGKELVSLLQYWLDAMRKHLIRHSHHWWSFLKQLLKFIKIIRTKDRSLPDILVEGTTECLLDLAASSEPDILQRHEILCCLNVCCAESSREIRFALRNKFETYFTKLATLLSTCGHLPTQYSILEALLRWLLPRHDPAVRSAAAKKWFPEQVCGKKALNLFLERPWQDFFQDARDFLNACNETAGLVTSAVCRKVSIGTVVVVQGTEKRATWLDVNVAHRSLSVVLDPRLLETIGVDVTTWETLMLVEENITSVQLFRESLELTLLIHTSEAPRLCPIYVEVSNSCEARIVVSSSTDLRRLDSALRNAFSHKYQVLLDLDKQTSLSPQGYRENTKRIQNSLEEETRFSHPVEIQKRKRAGFIVRTRNPVLWPSPSTASTTSLAQLHEKLASLPQYKFEKEAVHVCALPELSTVTEISETDDRQSLLSSQTLKISRPFGVCQKNLRTSDRNSQSDGEVHNKSKVGRYLSPVEKDEEHSTNCLLVATIGSADESVINDTLERLTRNKDFHADNIVDLLVQESLQKDLNDREFSDSGINTGDNTKKTQNVNEVNSETIENTPLVKLVTRTVDKSRDNEKTCTVISNTTTDESNDVVCETPINFVNVKKRSAKKKTVEEKNIELLEKPEDSRVFDVKTVEDFFCQHITENQRGDIVISPTLARKINETSSESEQFDDCLIMREDNNVKLAEIELQDIEIVECLNNIVDKVCSDFDKCTEILDRDTEGINIIGMVNNVTVENPPDIVPLADISNIENASDRDVVGSMVIKPTKKPIRLKYTAKKSVKPKASGKRKNNKLALKFDPNMTPIEEVKSIEDVQEKTKVLESLIESPKNNSPTSESTDLDTPLIRRKRKLYSPKYEDIDSQTVDCVVNDNEDFKDSKLQTPKYKSTCYKDIEMDRKKKIRQPRVRKSKAKFSTPSPRTKKKDDMFDKLKEQIECPVTMVMPHRKTERDITIYNFTSDSEDEDFKKKKIEVQKRISSTTVASCDSAMSTRHGRTVNRVNYSESKSSDEAIKKTSKPKKAVRRKRTPRTKLVKPNKELIDEKMRKAISDEINTSILVENAQKDSVNEPELKLAVHPEMEVIPDDVVIEVKDYSEKPKRSNKKQKKTELSVKKEKNVHSKILNVEQDNDDRTISPLPGLVVETMPSKVDDANDSVSINMLQKLKKIHEGGPEEFINETNTTQNLLSDVERMNYSPMQINITDEFNEVENKLKVNDENSRNSAKSKNKHTKAKNTNIMQKKKEKINTNEQNVTAEIINLSDTKSEKSIATVGNSPITAHGDSDEPPPDSELLTQNVKPRGLDIEYLDQSMKEYYDKLRNAIEEFPMENSRRKSNDSVSTKVLDNPSANSKDRSPTVSMKRLSNDDILKWLPSPRNSDTDSKCSEESEGNRKFTNMKYSNKINYEIINETTQLTSSIDHISYENNDVDIRRSKRKKTKPVVLKYECSPKNEVFKSTNNGENSKWMRSHENKNPDKSLDNSKDHKKKETKTTGIVNRKECNRKSTISPIRMFGEICSNGSQKSPILNQKTSLSRQESLIARQDSSIDIQASSFLRQESNEKERFLTDEDNCVDNDKSKKIKRNKTDKIKVFENVDQSSDAKESEGLRIDAKSSKLKRKSDSPEVYLAKKRKEDIVALSESGPSESSINDWFRRNVPVSRDESQDTSFREHVQSVMEKLDTTLAEIHQSTSTKFIHMFVDAQTRLAEMKRERRNLYRTVASEILAGVVKLIDDKFADLDKRSQEMQGDFTDQLKAQASQLIREDCKKKQLMVSLLREDLNATLARIEKCRGSTS